MSNTTDRKYHKTKFEGVFWRLSAKRDPRTGELDRVYSFWYADHKGNGHWKTVGRHSTGMRPLKARAQRAQFLVELDAGVDPVQRDKITVGHAVDAYASWARTEGKAVAKHHGQYLMHLAPKIHALPLADVTPGLLSALKKGLVETKVVKRSKGAEKKPRKRLAGQTVNNVFCFIRAAVNQAISTKLWSGANPFATRRGGPWQLLKVNNARLRFLTPDEAKSLLVELKRRNPPQLHDMALLSLRTGLRATEIFKLKGQDVDAHAGVLYIMEKGGSRVAVRIPEDMIAMLKSYDRKPGEALFKTSVLGAAFKKTPPSFGQAVKALNLAPEDGDSLYAVTFHTLRHTFASWLAQSGKVTLIELKTLMRHKNINMTLRYAHLIPGQESEKLSIIDGLLA